MLAVAALAIIFMLIANFAIAFENIRKFGIKETFRKYIVCRKENTEEDNLAGSSFWIEVVASLLIGGFFFVICLAFFIGPIYLFFVKGDILALIIMIIGAVFAYYIINDII